MAAVARIRAVSVAARRARLSLAKSKRRANVGAALRPPAYSVLVFVTFRSVSRQSPLERCICGLQQKKSRSGFGGLRWAVAQGQGLACSCFLMPLGRFISAPIPPSGWEESQRRPSLEA